MSLDLNAETSHHAGVELRVPEPKRRLAKTALILCVVLFAINVALIEYDFNRAGGDGPGGFTFAIFALIVAPTLGLAAWLYASRQALRTFSLCVFPPVVANAVVWWGLTAGHSLGLKVPITGALIACVVWLVLIPCLGAFANHITSRTAVRHPKQGPGRH